MSAEIVGYPGVLNVTWTFIEIMDLYSYITRP
jgi:hypothetical protein